MPKQISLISIAENEIDQAHGLKYVKQMNPDSGMLFKFQSPRILNFWMQDTWLPLDIAFIDHENMIVKTERMIPLSLRTVSSGRPCCMALETPAGTLDNVQIQGKKIAVDWDKKQLTIDD
jgi:hypothetical protein